MDNFQYRQLIEAVETQTREIRSIYELIVRVVLYSAIIGVAFGMLTAASA
jgi:hypothetical protein